MTVRQGQILELPVEAFANAGRCVARLEGKVVFVKGALPGERVRMLVTRQRKDFIEAEVVEVMEAAPERCKPICPHFGFCGGCQWQHMDYAAQLRYKQQMVVETLQRLGGIEADEILPIQGSALTQGYRNKLEFTFSHRAWQPSDQWRTHRHTPSPPALGYHLPGAFDRVFNVETCFLQPNLSDDIRNGVRQFAIENQLSFFHLKKQTGLLRTLMIRMTTTGQVLVLVVFGQDHPDQRERVLHYLHSTFPQITSLQFAINRKKNDSLTDVEIHTYHGTPYVEERLGKLTLRISAKSFFQTNTRQAEKLYEGILQMAELTGTQLVFDLYAGIGSIGLYMAPHCRLVVAVESVAEAVADARINASVNQVHNIVFQQGDVVDVLDALIQTHGHPEVVIVDPPRAGLHRHLISRLLDVKPRRIIYVSCHVATQARDLQMLQKQYRVARIQPFDLFPHTHHIENLTLLLRKV